MWYTLIHLLMGLYTYSYSGHAVIFNIFFNFSYSYGTVHSLDGSLECCKGYEPESLKSSTLNLDISDS